MKTIVYSPAYREKILQIRQYLEMEFVPQTAQKSIREITDRVNQLTVFENSGMAVKDVLGVDVDYRVIFAVHNYIFYRTDEKRIYIVNIYNEREDFMQKLFGIHNPSADTNHYWND